MRILALVPYPLNRAPGQRYRLEQWAPLLEEMGAEITFEAFRCEELHSLLCQPGNTRRKVYLASRALVRRLKTLKLVANYDLVYIYNEAALLGPALIENFISMRKVPIVFDFDDAIKGKGEEVEFETDEPLLLECRAFLEAIKTRRALAAPAP